MKERTALAAFENVPESQSGNDANGVAAAAPVPRRLDTKMPLEVGCSRRNGRCQSSSELVGQRTNFHREWQMIVSMNVR